MRHNRNYILCMLATVLFIVQLMNDSNKSDKALHIISLQTMRVPHLFNSPKFYSHANHSRYYFIPKPKSLQNWSCQCDSLCLLLIVFHRWHHMVLIAVLAGSGLFACWNRFFAPNGVHFCKFNWLVAFTLIENNLYFWVLHGLQSSILNFASYAEAYEIKTKAKFGKRSAHGFKSKILSIFPSCFLLNLRCSFRDVNVSRVEPFS